MAQTHYPPYYAHLHYRSPQVSPVDSPYGYPSPRYSAYTSSPTSRTHARRATHDFTYSTPQRATYNTAYLYPEDREPTSSTRRRADYVSASDHLRSHDRSSRIPTTGSGGYQYRYATQKCPGHIPLRSSQYVYNDVFVDYRGDERLSAYDSKYRYSPPPQPSPQQGHYRGTRNAGADAYASYYQMPIFTQADDQHAHRSRARRASTSTRPSPPPPPPRRSPPKALREATAEDVRRAGIPAGYSYKHWDPTEEPILLLGSVFDANSLGKWIYDWTVAFHGPATPMSEIAGDLWLLLIQLAGKVRRGEENIKRVRRQDDRELIDEFLDSGERLWQRFNKLLKIAESSMLKIAKKESRDGKKVLPGKNSGREFVNCVFGRDRELERTEKLMNSIRTWSMRFDANCDDILRNPTA